MAKFNHDEAKAKLITMKGEAEELIKSYNELYQEGKFADANAVAEQADKKIAEYTALVRQDCYETCKESEHPLKAAVTMLSFVTIATKDEKEGEAKIPVRKLVDKERQIDLGKLYQYCGKIGHDANWLYMAERFNCLLTARKVKELNAKIIAKGDKAISLKELDNSFTMSAIAKSIDLGENPVSNTKLLKTLQNIVTAMLGDGYKATSHDVNYLLEAYTRKSRKALTIQTANNKALRGYLAEICHRIVTDGQYGVEVREVKIQ